MTVILGINAFHADAAATIIKDGKIVGAVEEERFNRVKHTAGFPSESIYWCLNEASLKITDVEHICINSNPLAHSIKRVQHILTTRPSLRFIAKRIKNRGERSNLKSYLRNLFPDQRIKADFYFIDHHLAHLSSAFYPSPFKEASVISVDGFGDFASGAWGFGYDCNIRVDGHVFFPHSLGAFYTAITQFLGFPNYGDEYKVMGLAPYGKPIYMHKMREVVKLTPDGLYQLDLRFFQHSGKKDIDHQWSHGSPKVGKHWSNELATLLGPSRNPTDPIEQRHMDIACSAQSMYEEALFNLLHVIYERDKCPNLCIAGGCGANSVANGKVASNTKFNHVYVQAAAGDAGGSLGAALYVWHRLSKERCLPMSNAYLGCSFKHSEILDIINDNSVRTGLTDSHCLTEELSDDDICNDVVDLLVKGCVVGWFEGKMEWGPRALGHRSILGDPRRKDMQEILNKKIKRRESFRPFAPSILRECVKDWFVTDGDVPFMMQVFTIREELREKIPAVTHVDGTGRLQTVTKLENGRYYSMISSFYKKTGVPMVLNTSFNENEPIVCTPQEAINCFLRTSMDALVLENIIIKRPSCFQF